MYLTGVGTYERYVTDIDDGGGRWRGKGQFMFSDEWLTVIKAEREREIKAAQRAHLADRDRLTDEPADEAPTGIARSFGRTVRPSVQPGRATADPSL